ncbi:MAG TPA: hypothetical protein VHO48_02600, partial [Anaerolineaceae bacterium]|nr:hypothetical protein [Anaerolineaceae bacterium]
MNLLEIKLILTPLLIAAATFAARRWGPVVGGLLAGLPLVSGPISVFLALEQGPAFAARAGQGTLLGLIALVAFCAVYARAANRFPWPAALTGGVAIYALSAWALTSLTTGVAVTVLIVFALVCIALWIVGDPPAQSGASSLPGWDLPLRMLAATALVLLITGLSSRLGATWSGLLAPFPVFTSVMAVFSHRQSGAAAAQQLLR